MRLMRTLLLAVIPAFAGGCKRHNTDTPAPGQPIAASAAPPLDPNMIRTDGSSTVFPITDAIAEEFEKANQGLEVSVGISGTGGGFKKFCAGETDIANASRPIKRTEVELCQKNGIEFVEIPIAYDGLAILTNPRNTWATEITTAELKKMWEPDAQGKVATWKDIRSSWPDKPLRLYGAGGDSGTYDYFTLAIVQKEHSIRGDYISSEDDNIIVQGVANEESALGFAGYAYYSENKDKLSLLPVDDGEDGNGKGAVAPSPDTVVNGTYQPLSRPIFIYVAKRALDKPAVLKFVTFFVTKGARLIKNVGYFPLPDSAYAMAKTRVETRRTGSLLGGRGSQVGVSIEDLLEKDHDPGQ